METKDCEKVLDLLNQYIDGELNASDAWFVRAHIENCADCRKAYNELMEIERLFGEAVQEAPAELHETVMAKIKAEKSTVVKRRKFTRRLGGFAVAAAISLTVLSSPAILLMASKGGAVANDMAEALAPSKGENADNSYSGGMEPEYGQIDDHLTSNDGKYGTLDSIKDIIPGITEDADRTETEDLKPITVQYGKEYTACLADGSETSIIFTETSAILGDTSYEYKLEGNSYILTDGVKILVFKPMLEHPDGEMVFKQSE